MKLIFTALTSDNNTCAWEQSSAREQIVARYTVYACSINYKNNADGKIIKLFAGYGKWLIKNNNQNQISNTRMEWRDWTTMKTKR